MKRWKQAALIVLVISGLIMGVAVTAGTTGKHVHTVIRGVPLFGNRSWGWDKDKSQTNTDIDLDADAGSRDRVNNNDDVQAPQKVENKQAEGSPSLLKPTTTTTEQQDPELLHQRTVNTIRNYFTKLHKLSRKGGEAIDNSSKKYFACVCSMTRNERDLIEWTTRQLMAGVEHIFLYDNNRIGLGLDMNISGLIRPFVEAGYITHIPFEQSQVKRMGDTMKYSGINQCLQNRIPECVWGTVGDTDEMWYAAIDKQDIASSSSSSSLAEVMLGIDQLNHETIYSNNNMNNNNNKQPNEKDDPERRDIGLFPAMLAQITTKFPPKTMDFQVRWTSMYSEEKLLRSANNEPLLTSFPRTCRVDSQLGKHWFLVDGMAWAGDHVAGPKKGYLEKQQIPAEYSQKFQIVHYYFRTMEDFLLKYDQSFWRWTRNFREYPDRRSKCNAVSVIHYTKAHTDTVNFFVSLTAQLHPRGYFHELDLDPLTFMDTPTEEWPLYMLFKWAIGRRLEWDGELYMATNTNYSKIIKTQFQDSLHHFLSEGSQKPGCVPCFKNAQRRFCLRSAEVGYRPALGKRIAGSI